MLGAVARGPLGKLPASLAVPFSFLAPSPFAALRRAPVWAVPSPFAALLWAASGPLVALRGAKPAGDLVAPIARRHWCTAQCSESTGTISAPGVLRTRWTTGPAGVRDSLLAGA